MNAVAYDKSAMPRRYIRRVVVATAGYVVTLLLAVFLIEKRGVDGAPAIILALLPAVFVAGLF